MSGVTLLWLGGATGVFLTATAMLRAYVSHPLIGWVAGALVLYCIGNLMMLRVMRDSGMALAVAVSAVVQLVFAALVAVILFDERPTGMQWAGIALGVVAVALIVWPQEATR